MSTLETLQDLLMHDHQLTREQVAPEARLPDLGWLTPLGRRLGALVTAQTFS